VSSPAIQDSTMPHKIRATFLIQRKVSIINTHHYFLLLFLPFVTFINYFLLLIEAHTIVVGLLGWRALGVGVVLRFIYLFLVWESWDTRFWRRVFLDFFDCFWGKGGGLVLDLIFF
jgi:hypothetical protein